MKAKVATLLLVCYAVVLLRPVVPLLTDMMAHMFWESEHMATVHYENGSYHVHLEVKEATEKSGQHNSGLPGAEKSEAVPHFTACAELPPYNIQSPAMLIALPPPDFISDGYVSIPLSPPWVS